MKRVVGTIICFVGIAIGLSSIYQKGYSDGRAEGWADAQSFEVGFDSEVSAILRHRGVRTYTNSPEAAGSLGWPRQCVSIYDYDDEVYRSLDLQVIRQGDDRGDVGRDKAGSISDCLLDFVHDVDKDGRKTIRQTFKKALGAARE